MTDRPRRFVIAVVDDDEGILESLESLLESADYRVQVFSSGAALLGSDGLQEIDCLISDVGMPVMDGFELVRAAQAYRPGLPAILITGRPDLLERPPLDWQHQCRVITKPFDGQALLTAVEDALRGSEPRTPQP